MATGALGAPLPTGRSTLVAGAQFQEVVQRSRSLTQKVLLSVPDAHRSCVRTETLQLNSTENAKLSRMAATIGLPTAPVLKVVSENVTLELSLQQMSAGLQLQQDVLGSVSPRLQHGEKVTALMADIRDLSLQINKMLKMAQAEGSVQPSPTPLALNLPGEYEVQVAAHLALVQLQAFGQDLVRCLRVLDQSNEEETES